MSTYTDSALRALDIASGEELDRLSARKSRTILPGASPHLAQNLPIQGPTAPVQPKKRSEPDLYSGIKPWRP